MASNVYYNGLAITESMKQPEEESEESIRAKEEELQSVLETARKEKNEISWLKKWLEKEEERKKVTGPTGEAQTVDESLKIPDIQLSREQQKAEMTELVKLIEKNKRQKEKKQAQHKKPQTKRMSSKPDLSTMPAMPKHSPSSTAVTSYDPHASTEPKFDSRPAICDLSMYDMGPPAAPSTSEEFHFYKTT